ncbi:MAG: hypothetical protein IJV40_09925 [Oscillospiraceae bacterium]|nr:hypothetical protein [Oscillospiraceae bacterium]
MKVRLLIGVCAGVLMMLLSYWMDGFGLMSDAEAWMTRPIWSYALCMILAMLGVPAMCVGLSGWYEIICSVQAKRWVKCLSIVATVCYAVSSLYLIAIDCLPPIVFQTAANLGIAPEVSLTLIERIEHPYEIPIIVFFLMEDLGISIVLWQLILSGKLYLGKWWAVCCPAVMLIADILLKRIPSALTRNISVTLESAGWMLFMLAGLIHLKRKGNLNDCT